MVIYLFLRVNIVFCSGQQLKDSMLLVEDSAKRLLSGKSVFEYFLSPLIPQTDWKTSTPDNHEGRVPELRDQGNAETGDDNKSVEEGQIVDSSVVATVKQPEDSQDRNQGKGSKKPKSGKKKKGKKNQ